jgi:hypothetical protein
MNTTFSGGYAESLRSPPWVIGGVDLPSTGHPDRGCMVGAPGRAHLDVTCIMTILRKQIEDPAHN